VKENTSVTIPLFVKILKNICPRIGAAVWVNIKEWDISGQITFKNGFRRYFRYSSLDINPFGASEIAKYKDSVNRFLEVMGYPIIPNSEVFFSSKWGSAIGLAERNIDQAYSYAKKLGWPIFVKPNSGSRGAGVWLVNNRDEFYRAMRLVFQYDLVALVQPYVQGRDYRIVVLDDKVVCAYERIPLNVIGDGKSTIFDLLESKNSQLISIDRKIEIQLDDQRILHKLRRQKMTFSSIPDAGQKLYLLDNSNLCTGGDAVDVTEFIHPEFSDIAINVTKNMGLRFCGVDVLVDGDISESADKYHILEINSSPGFEHFYTIGPTQKRIVEDMYLDILISME